MRPPRCQAILQAQASLLLTLHCPACCLHSHYTTFIVDDCTAVPYLPYLRLVLEMHKAKVYIGQIRYITEQVRYATEQIGYIPDGLPADDWHDGSQPASATVSTG